MLTLTLLSLACGEPSLDLPVRATLDDGQRVVGAVETELLRLVTDYGTLAIPLSDVGEVRPVESDALGGSANHVGVWLRNGSELRGRWEEPELRMSIWIDEQPVELDLPMESLTRFQFQGGDLLPLGQVYRLRTIYGDDLVVDAEQTRLRMESDLGTVFPLLAEIHTLAPATGDPAGDWRMELFTGTVLIGSLGGMGEDPEALELRLPLGPETITLDVAAITRIERQDWGDYGSWSQDYRSRAAPAVEALGYVEGDSGGWFDNRVQQEFKSSR